MQTTFRRSRIPERYKTLRRKAMKRRGACSLSSKNILTPREIEVLTLIARGYAYARIAYVLTISEDMAKTHVENTRRKLNAKNKTHAVALALINGLIKL